MYVLPVLEIVRVTTSPNNSWLLNVNALSITLSTLADVLFENPYPLLVTLLDDPSITISAKITFPEFLLPIKSVYTFEDTVLPIELIDTIVLLPDLLPTTLA